MGLDSVELIVSFEDYFNIQISDIEAGQIGTIRELQECVAQHLQITNTIDILKDKVFAQVKQALFHNGVKAATLSYTDPVFKLLHPDKKEVWAKVSQELGLLVPLPLVDHDGFLKRTFGISLWKPPYNWETLTTEHLVWAICGANYKQLIDAKAITQPFEILAVIIGGTTDKMGLDIYEVQPDKTLTNDLGID